MKRRSLLFGIAGLIVTGALLVGSLPASGKSQVIRIGSHFPTSGRMSEAGQKVQKGAQVAIQAFEKRSGYKVEMIQYDDESNPQKGVGLVERLAGRDKVVAILGSYGSHIAGPASEVAERYGVPYFAHLGATSRQFDKRGFKSFFRFGHVPGYVEAQVGFLTDLIKVKQVAILYSSELASADVASLLKETLGAKGVAVSVFERFEPNTVNFQPLLLKVRDGKVPFLVGVGYTQDYLTMIRDAKTLDLPVQGFLGAWAFGAVLEKLGPLGETLFGAAYWAPGAAPAPARAEEKAFMEAYEREHKQAADYLGMAGYVATRLVLEAAERADARGALTPAGVTAELQKVDVVTPMGRVAFDSEGNPRHFLNIVFQVQGGKELVVFPTDRATGKLKYPAVSWRP